MQAVKANGMDMHMCSVRMPLAGRMPCGWRHSATVQRFAVCLQLWQRAGIGAACVEDAWYNPNDKQSGAGIAPCAVCDG